MIVQWHSFGSNKVKQVSTAGGCFERFWRKLLLEIPMSHFNGTAVASPSYGGESLWPLLLTWFNFNPSMDK